MSGRSDFAGGNQRYLRDVQYGSSAKLDVRIALHERFSSATVDFPEFASELLSWSDGLRVLECGAGSGRFWENRHAHKSSELTLTDLSAGMVEQATSHAAANGFKDVTGRQCDIQDMPFDDDSFDLIIANHMIYHVPDPDLAIAEVARVLRPDGAFLASTNGGGHMREMKESIAEVFDSEPHALHEVFGIDTGEARLREHFKLVSWHSYDNDLIVTDPAAATAYGLSYPPGESATEQQAAAFAAVIERRFTDGAMRIHTRSGAFVCGNPR